MPIRLEAAARVGGGRSALDAAGWLGLAAAPTFAAMALATALADEPAPLCSAPPGGWRPGGMTTMYLLMAVFHLPAWLRPAQALLAIRWASAARRSGSASMSERPSASSAWKWR